MKAIIFCLLILGITSANDVPYIEVFFESLCPGCREFITTSFADYIKSSYYGKANVDFIPYGNAHESYDSKKDWYSFTCQHGENECYGNLLETCAINLLPKEKFDKTLVCIENNIYNYDEDFDQTMRYCLRDSPYDVRDIQECMNGKDGNLYEHKMAERTPSSHYYVPWVHVDGVHDTDKEDQIMDSLIDFLKNLEKEKEKVKLLE